MPLDIRLDLENIYLPSGNWNWVDGGAPTKSDLIDYSTGLATSVDVALAGVALGVGDSQNWTAGVKGWMNDEAGDDGVGGNSTSDGTTWTATFSDLLASSYVVEVVASDRNACILDISVNNRFADGNYNNTPGVNGHNFNAQTDGRDPGNWLIWSAVTPTNGTIRVRLTKVGGSGFTVGNAIRLSVDEAPIPEPGTLALVGLGLAGLLRRRRARARR